MAETLGERFDRLREAGVFGVRAAMHGSGGRTEIVFKEFAAYILQLEQANADHAAKVLELEAVETRLQAATAEIAELLDLVQRLKRAGTKLDISLGYCAHRGLLNEEAELMSREERDDWMKIALEVIERFQRKSRDQKSATQIADDPACVAGGK